MPLYGQKKFSVINQSLPRIDGLDKVTGRARYAADCVFPGMIYGGMLRSNLASARVVSIDTSAAEAMEGVRAVVTAKNMKKCRSWASYMYVTDRVLYVGDVVAFLAADTRELVEEALKAIKVEYEELPAVYTIEEALKPGAPQLHEEYPGNIFTPSKFSIRKGDVEKAFAQADYIIERRYSTQYVEHSYIEPEAVVAYENPNDGVMTAHASAQNPFFTRRYMADALGVPLNRVRLVQEMLGGSFGGKEEGVGLITGRAAVLAKLTGKPVKMVFSREESFMESSKRHPFEFHYKAGVTKEGKIIAWEGTQIDNSGAYNNQTQFMNWRASVHSAGAYDIDNIKTDTFGVFTNNVHSGAFRGYSSPSLLYAQEQFIDEIAEEIGMNEIEFRRINCLKNGTRNSTGTVMGKVILQEVMDYTVEQTDYMRKHGEYKKQTDTEKRRGIGLAIAHRGCGLGAEAPDAAAGMVIANEDGSVLINSGLAENGQGLRTAYSMIAAEALGVKYENVQFYGTDSHSIPDSGMTVASRGTVMGAQAVKKAALELNRIMRGNAIKIGKFSDTKKIEEACGLKEGSLSDLKIENEDQIILRDGFFYIPEYPDYKVAFADVTCVTVWTGMQMSNYAWFIPPDCIQDHHTGQGRAFPTYAYGCVIAEVEVDMRTGYVDVVKVTASHDVGTAINPALITGQVYGGIVMGQGYGVMEEVEVHKGKVGNPNFDSYILPTALDMPDMRVNIFECDDENGTFGAKSVGEPATESVGAAIANAVYNATGRRIRQNPANLEKVLLGKNLR
ncbi:MAG: xanthine dehydrogenase family protein molybdopterin-binding subunit [Bacillota bacterium]